MEKQLGKIKRVTLGNGGYDDAMFGVSFDLGGDSWGIGDFWGSWSWYSDHAKYSKESWEKSHLDAYSKLRELMRDAKVKDIRQLEGIPVEVTTNQMKLVSWRVLTEVL